MPSHLSETQYMFEESILTLDSFILWCYQFVDGIL